MVLERSFDTVELKKMLAGSEMLVDLTVDLDANRRHDPSWITRPPLPKGSFIFEKVLDEFQPQRIGPGPSSLLRAPSPKRLKPPSAGHRVRDVGHHRPRSPADYLRPRSPAGVRASSRSNSPVQKPPSPRLRGNVIKRHNSPQSRPNNDVKELQATYALPESGGVEMHSSC